MVSAPATRQVGSCMAIAIDNRSVLREAVLPESSSFETAPQEDPDDTTRKTYLLSTYLGVDMAFRPTAQPLQHASENGTNFPG